MQQKRGWDEGRRNVATKKKGRERRKNVEKGKDVSGATRRGERKA